jgi:predicted PurR-regulated permease PerM
MTGAVPGDPRVREGGSSPPDTNRPAEAPSDTNPHTASDTGSAAGDVGPDATGDGPADKAGDAVDALDGSGADGPVDGGGFVDGDGDRHGLRAALSTMTTRMMAERTVRASEAAAAAAAASSEAAEALTSSERVAARPYYSPFKWGFYGGIGVLLAYVAFLALDSIRSTLILIAIATLLAIGLNPIVTWLTERGLRRGIAVAAVFLALLLAMAGAVYAIVPPIVNELGRFIASIPDLIADLQQNPTIQDLDQRFGILQALNNSDFVQTLGTGAAGNILTAGFTLAGIFVDVLIILILTLYFLAGFPRIKHGAFSLVPRSRRARVVELGDRVLRQMGGYLSGATIISIQAGLIAGIFASIVGLPYPWAIALGAAVLDFIPVVGPVIVGVSMTLIGFTQGIAIGIIAGAFYLAQHMFETYWLYPRVMRRTVDISTGAVVVAIIVGGALLGVTGAILAVPVAAAVILITREVVMPIQEHS